MLAAGFSRLAWELQPSRGLSIIHIGAPGMIDHFRSGMMLFWVSDLLKFCEWLKPAPLKPAKAG